jgi:hypothetical protein
MPRRSVPMSAEDAADPNVVSFANAVAELVLRRVELDLPETRSSLQLDVTDPGVLELLSLTAGKIVRNEDGVRPGPCIYRGESDGERSVPRTAGAAPRIGA